MRLVRVWDVMELFTLHGKYTVTNKATVGRDKARRAIFVYRDMSYSVGSEFLARLCTQLAIVKSALV